MSRDSADDEESDQTSAYDSKPRIEKSKPQTVYRRVDPERPDDVKYEVAQEMGVPLQQGNNGKLTTEEAGKVGGKIGGSMVREMIRMAQEKLSKRT
jgi:hypothetical protein